MWVRLKHTCTCNSVIAINTCMAFIAEHIENSIDDDEEIDEAEEKLEEMLEDLLEPCDLANENKIINEFINYFKKKNGDLEEDDDGDE